MRRVLILPERRAAPRRPGHPPPARGACSRPGHARGPVPERELSRGKIEDDRLAVAHSARGRGRRVVPEGVGDHLLDRSCWVGAKPRQCAFDRAHRLLFRPARAMRSVQQSPRRPPARGGRPGGRPQRRPRRLGRCRVDTRTPRRARPPLPVAAPARRRPKPCRERRAARRALRSRRRALPPATRSWAGGRLSSSRSTRARRRACTLPFAKRETVARSHPIPSGAGGAVGTSKRGSSKIAQTSARPVTIMRRPARSGRRARGASRPRRRR